MASTERTNDSDIQETLAKTVIALPLLKELEEEARRQSRRRELAAKRRRSAREREELQNLPGAPALYSVIIDLNLTYSEGRDKARAVATELVREATANRGQSSEQGIQEEKSRLMGQYLFARLEGEVIREVVRLDAARAAAQPPALRSAWRAIHHIWPDFPIRPLLNRSLGTIKADAARTAFSALGKNILWAVMDSGIDATHRHFARHQNLQNLPEGVEHQNFVNSGTPLTDEFGHGTHVAGIIAGETRFDPADPASEIFAYSRRKADDGDDTHERVPLTAISGVSPECKLLSLKVLNHKGDGEVSSMLAAIQYIQEVNSHGRFVRVHGVNMSVGYGFDPEWFACGQSPLCVEVDRLARMGVVVVVAAGNTGYGRAQTAFRGVISAGMDLTINDPGNADLAITVGSTHRDMPHVYGVSYFSSKGPTGDGRSKPDLLAPGEKILSCAAGRKRDAILELMQEKTPCHYLEESGTSMAAPHVSGAIAAFLSIRHEFIGRPQVVKEIFLSTATDLKRERYFQGHGLVDLMRAIQSV
jgi:hypothetical protein